MYYSNVYPTGQTPVTGYDAMAEAMMRNRQAQPMQQSSPMNNIASAMLKRQMMGGGSSGNTLNANPGGWSESVFGGSGGAPASSGGASTQGGSAMSSAGPWAALAALIIANESEAQRGGYRDENRTHRAVDMLGGKVVEQDVHKRWSPKLFGKDDKYGMGADANMAADLSTLDFSNAWKTFKNDSTLAKSFKKIF